MRSVYYIIYCGLAFLFSSCSKYLSEKPDKKLVIPASVQDLQGLLDYHYYMNDACSEATEVAADNYYLPDAIFQGLADERNRSAYLWQPDMFLNSSPNDWQNEYTVVYNANVVLDNIGDIARDAFNAVEWDKCKGGALVFRGKSFYEAAQIWAGAYDGATAGTEPGIPLKVSSDFNLPSKKATLQATYDQIIRDLKESASLLPGMPSHPLRASRAAAYGLLARTYLTMGDYVQAKLYADSCLAINNRLLDYNTLDPAASYPFTVIQYTNPEDIMHSVCAGANYRDLRNNRARIDSVLYQSYDVNDLRRNIFFGDNGDGSHFFKGNYDGGSTLNYNGVATDEIYLTRAECYARQGNVSGAMNDLNALLVSRWKSGTFTPLTATDASDALAKVLVERRKELVFRMLRFTDIKRLNKQGANISLKRIIGGKTYTLPAGDPRFALQIPLNAVQIGAIEQNPGW